MVVAIVDAFGKRQSGVRASVVGDEVPVVTVLAFFSIKM